MIGAAPARLTADQISAVASAAGQAPSVHNSQPWRLNVRGGDLYLSADPDRRLPAADPDGREMILSCGAALYNLVLALRDLGHRPAVRLLPDPDYPHRLAVAHPAGGAAPADGDEARCAAIPVRRTNRGAFDGTPVPAGLLRGLRSAARAEDAELIVFDEEADIRVLATITELASYMHIRDAAYAAEHARWMRTGASARADGIHPARLADASSTSDPSFPPRFVDTTRSPKPAAPWPVGTVALITTAGDGPRHWLHAGMALQRILLDLTVAGFVAALHTQPLEIPHLRAFVAGEFTYDRPPQVLLRMGHVPAGSPAVPSIRRPVADFLTMGA